MKVDRKPNIQHETQSSINPSSRIKLLDLPDHVIEIIIFEVRAIARAEADKIKERRWKHVFVEWAEDEAGKSGVAYKPPAPILSSVQALSVVNRRLHNLCQSSLWGHLEFPTSLPSDLIDWTKNLMPKYGEFVRSITIIASPGWIMPPLQSDIYMSDNKIILTGNVTCLHGTMHRPSSWGYTAEICEEGRYYISPENATKLLVNCPYLKTFNMIFPPTWINLSTSKQTVLTDRLSSLVSNLTGLRSLSFEGEQNFAFPAECVIKILEYLPLLETFSIFRIGKLSSEEISHSIGGALAKLRYLKKLRIHNSSLMWQAWLDHDWSGSLSQLTLPFNKEMSVAEFKRFITSVAPNVTHLDLRFGETTADSTLLTYQSTLSPEDCLDLRSLVELVINHRNDCTPIGAFQRCTQIRKIHYLDLPAEDWPSFGNLICSQTWPQLEYLEICCPDTYNPADWGIVMAQEKLRKYCRAYGICLSVESLNFLN